MRHQGVLRKWIKVVDDRAWWGVEI
jgi:hypothetical protein